MIFLVRCCLPVVCKLVCFPFAACFPWSANVLESITKQLELHLGPFWSCNLQWGTGWATKQLVLSPAVGSSSGRHPRAAPAQGSSPWGMVSVPGWAPPLGKCQCWSQWMLWWKPGLFGNSACSWAVWWQPANRAAFKSASDIPEEHQMLRLHPEGRFETWQQEAVLHPSAHGSHHAALYKGQGRSTSRCSDSECSFLPASYLPGQQWLWSFGFFIFNYCG